MASEDASVDLVLIWCRLTDAQTKLKHSKSTVKQRAPENAWRL
jgi:hypothetical protein